LYPWIDLLERVALRFEREESPQQKLRKLEGFLVQYGLPLAEAVPLFAALLSLPLAADYAPLNLSSEQQKQQTLQALMTILLRIAAQQPVLVVMEDLHWVDPSTLELLSLLVDQGPTARILALLTFRPDFSPPWTGRAHCTQVTVNRLSRTQAAEVIRQVAHGKALPPEVVEQIVAKTDGVPLFVEELTKMVLESGLLQESEERYALTGPLPPLAIPATLHDSLMARLDRLATVKAMAQLGATLGREFSYELLRAVSPWDEGPLQRGLHQLVEAEFLYQRGLLPQATYLFKHALIQEAAYQSLLRSTRQQHHQHIAQVLEAQFPETVETQPELLAHHYTEAGHNDRAVDYWHKAGQKAMAHSAYVEAIAHLNTGLAQLVTLPETSELVQQELDMQITLGRGLMAMKGYGALEVGHAYSRAWALCQQVGETLHTTQSLWGLSSFHYVRRELQTAYELGTQCLTSAQRLEDAEGRISAHAASGVTLYTLGDLFAAREHLEQGIALYHPRQHPTLVARFAQDTGINCYNFVALTLWMLGYPHQALARSREMIALSQRLAHPYTLGVTLYSAARLHIFRREVEATLDLVEAFMQLAAEQAFAFLTGLGTIMRGWALVARGDVDAGLSDLREGITSVGSTGARVRYHLAYLAEAYAKAGRTDEGLRCVDEELALMDKTAERYYEAEFYRLKGILLLSQPLDHQAEAEVCFQQALTIARRQQAKSWELRAATSLARLWQHQDKRKEAYELLDQVYHWFTEGFDTTDLQETKTLLDELR
jgi:predicted ATPase